MDLSFPIFRIIMKNKIWLACIILLALINIIWFWPSNLYFLNDDLLHIPLTDAGKLFQTNSVRPIHELLVRLELSLFYKNASGYHITALLLHCIVCIQLFYFCLAIQTNWLKIAREKAIRAAFLSVVLFLIYPQSSELFGWILGRAPVLSAIFVLGTIHLFFIEKYKSSILLAGALLFGITLFAYEQSLFLPLAMFLLAYQEKQKAKQKWMFTYATFLTVVGVTYLVVRKVVTSEIVGNYEGGNFLRLNIVTLAANFLRIISRLFLNPAFKTEFIFSLIILVLVFLAILYFTVRIKVNKRALLFFVFMTILLIAPVLSLGLAVNSFESGRYLYLPSIFLITGVSIACSIVFCKYSKMRKPLIVLLIVVAVYWMKGKKEAATFYTEASVYSQTIEEKIQEHFRNSSDTLYIDTLRVTVRRLPVFRRGFKTGIKWLNNRIDTNKVVVRNYYDEVLHRELE